MPNENPTETTTIDAAPVETPKIPDAIANVCTDVRSFYAHKDPTALAICADLNDPSSSPQTGDDDDRNRVINEYRHTISDLIAMRTELDEHAVFTPPAEGTELHPLWGQYSDAIHSAHALRKAL